MLGGWTGQVSPRWGDLPRVLRVASLKGVGWSHCWHYRNISTGVWYCCPRGAGDGVTVWPPLLYPTAEQYGVQAAAGGACGLRETLSMEGSRNK